MFFDNPPSIHSLCSHAGYRRSGSACPWWALGAMWLPAGPRACQAYFTHLAVGFSGDRVGGGGGFALHSYSTLGQRGSHFRLCVVKKKKQKRKIKTSVGFFLSFVIACVEILKSSAEMGKVFPKRWRKIRPDLLLPELGLDTRRSPFSECGPHGG